MREIQRFANLGHKLCNNDKQKKITQALNLILYFWACPEVEPRTSRTLSENHASRPIANRPPLKVYQYFLISFIFSFTDGYL